LLGRCIQTSDVEVEYGDLLHLLQLSCISSVSPQRVSTCPISSSSHTQ
jgi:hypothetical protein